MPYDSGSFPWGTYRNYDYMAEVKGRKMAVATIETSLRLDESLEKRPELRFRDTAYLSRYREVPFEYPPEYDGEE